MRAPPTPSSLKWLINRYARLDGELSKLEKEQAERNAHAQAALQDLTERLEQTKKAHEFSCQGYEFNLKALQTEKAATELLIRQHEAGIDPSIIRPIRSQNNLSDTDYGRVTNLIFECLRFAGGLPCTATQVAAYAARFLDIDPASGAFSQLRYRIRQRMKNLAWLGKLARVSNQVGSLEGRWCLSQDFVAMSEPDTHPLDGVPANSHATSETAHCQIPGSLDP